MTEGPSIPKIVFISWAPYCSRSDYIALELGAKSYMVYYDFLGSNYYTILLKYLFQTVKTLKILMQERPKAILVMSPSVFASIPVFLYCKLSKAVFLIDAHTGALNNPMWKRVRFLQRYFSRKALLTIVTNKALAKQISDWDADYFIVPDVPINPRHPRLPTLDAKINVTMINTFATDEPTEVFLEAAKSMEKIQFHITGKISKRAKHYTDQSYQNITFTDFLENEDYYGLLIASDLVVVLTTQNDTMQRGAYEAIYCGIPVLTSDWDILRKSFPLGTVFAPNSVEGITKGINEALSNLDNLRHEVKVLRIQKEEKWNRSKEELLAMISDGRFRATKKIQEKI